MRVAVTGGMGFIGSEVIARLCAAGDEVVVVDFWERRLREYEVGRYPILELAYGNLSAAADVLGPDEFIARLRSLALDVVVHLGAVVDTTDLGSHDMFEQNVGYVRRLVDACNDGHHYPGIVFASSAATYGSGFRPNNPYGLTKVRGERIVSSTRGQFACLRFFNVFGSLEHHKGAMASVPFKLAQAYRSGDRFNMHNMDALRDFISVSSVATSVVGISRGMFESSEHDDPEFRCTYDVGTGKSTTFSDLDNFVMQATGNSTSIVREVEMPEALVGRYQRFTKAGVSAPLLDGSGQGTREGIEEQYGIRER